MQRNRRVFQAREVAVALDHPPQAHGRERMVPIPADTRRIRLSLQIARLVLGLTVR
jgi:hypothetical protein